MTAVVEGVVLVALFVLAVGIRRSVNISLKVGILEAQDGAVLVVFLPSPPVH